MFVTNSLEKEVTAKASNELIIFTASLWTKQCILTIEQKVGRMSFFAHCVNYLENTNVL